MILKNNLPAHLDLENSLFVLDSKATTVKELQQLSLQYVDKLEHMIENNERLIDILNQGQVFGYKDRNQMEI